MARKQISEWAEKKKINQFLKYNRGQKLTQKTQNAK